METMKTPEIKPGSRGKEVQLSLRAFLGLLIVLLLPGVLIVLSRLPNGTAWMACRTAEVEFRDGPWGRLEISDIAIAPVDIIVPGQPGKPLATTWLFEGFGSSRLKDLIQALDLTDSQRIDLLNTNAWSIAENGITLRPADETVLTLRPATRTRLYAVLGASTLNVNYFRPWSMKAGLFRERLVDSGMNSEAQKIIRGLAYAKGSRMFVSDVPVILNQLADEKQRRQVMRFLTSASTFLVQLDVPPNADVKSIMNYWENQDRRKDLEPILGCLSRLPKGGKLDLVHLLPGFANQRLYTYPDPGPEPDGVRRDCHWTSLNFFSSVPDDRFGNSDEASRYVLEHYRQIGGTPEFGDIVFYVLPTGGTIHSAVYLAGNLAFTKNGETPDQPWIIMDVNEIRELYSQYHHAILDMQFWRLKPD
jgi:hypothetical protein